MSNKYGSIDDFVQEQQNLKRKNADNGGHGKKGNTARTIGIVLCTIQLLLSLAFMGLLIYVNLLPMKYLIFIGAVLLILWAAAFLLQFRRKINIIGKVIAVAVSVVLVIGIRYVTVTNNVIDEITKKNQSKAVIAVAVLKDDPAQSLQDASGYEFGIQKSFGRKEVDQAVEDMGKSLGKQLSITEYSSSLDLINGILDGECRAIIINQSMLSTYDELYSTVINPDDDEEFSDKIRLIHTEDIVVEENSETKAPDTDYVTSQCFAIYVSGNDQYGDLTTTGRSDVNIIIFINPDTKQVLLLSTPRDYWVQIPDVTGQYRDKLTHAGNYGIETSIATLEQLYDCKIDYYIKINFDSVVQIIDALGGVNVYSEQEFTSNAGLHFNQGYNYMDGKIAIEFVRERKHLVGGDFARGRNQMAVITAMIDKLTSPALLMNYGPLMESIEDTFSTDMPQENIKALVRMQLDDNASWNVVSYAAKGTGAYDYCYTTGSQAAVVYADEASVAVAQQLIKDLKEGKTIQDPETETDDLTNIETTAY
ncbi:MAG: LCP family protein [Lachnospiraceae bacterium]|nr:LCP family protein [Lachnospiraceae bacterium]